MLGWSLKEAIFEHGNVGFFLMPLRNPGVDEEHLRRLVPIFPGCCAPAQDLTFKRCVVIPEGSLQVLAV